MKSTTYLINSVLIIAIALSNTFPNSAIFKKSGGRGI